MGKVNLIETSSLKYRVMVDGRVLSEASSPYMAERFIEGLEESVKAKAQIVPVTLDGKQVLMG